MQSLISVDEATHAVHAQPRARATESVALVDAVGRVLAEIEVASGAMLPEGCDCVIPIEHLVRTSPGYTLALAASPSRGQSIHRQSADCPAESRSTAGDTPPSPQRPHNRTAPA